MHARRARRRAGAARASCRAGAARECCARDARASMMKMVMKALKEDATVIALRGCP